MAEIRTTRMRLVQWTEGTDSPQRVDFNETFLNVETLAAIDQQGTIGNRPTPSKTGMYYFATDEGILYRSDGQSWAVVGSSTLSHLIRAARTDSVSLTIQAITGQTADLLRIITTSGGTLVRVRPNGDVLAGALRVSQAARTTTASDTAPTDSAVTVDNNSSTMWNTTAKNTTGNTAGYFRAIRGTSTVFSVGPDGSVSTPAVTLTSAPSSDSHAVRRTDLTTSVANATYNLDSSNIVGTLPISKGGTGRTAASPGAYPRWSADGNSFDGVTPANLRADIDAATSGHGHALTDSNITGVLPVAQGGTGATSVTAARSALSVPYSGNSIVAGSGLTGGGTLAASRTLQVIFEGNGTATTAARSDHGHALTDANVTGVLPVNQGGTGATTAEAARANLQASASGHGHSLTDANITGVLPVSQGGTGRYTITAGTYLRGNGTTEVTMLEPDQVLSDIDGLPRSVEVLPANQNIDNWTKTGTWVPAAWSQSSPANGYPNDANNSVVMLEHKHWNSAFATQKLSSSYKARIWRRVLRNGTWSEWVESEPEPEVYTIPLGKDRAWAGHGYRPQLIRDGKKRMLRGRVSPNPSTYKWLSGEGYDLFKIPIADLPSYTVGHIGQVTSFASPGFARIEIMNVSYPAGSVVASVSRDTEWIGLDGTTWYVD